MRKQKSPHEQRRNVRFKLGEQLSWRQCLSALRMEDEDAVRARAVLFLRPAHRLLLLAFAHPRRGVSRGEKIEAGLLDVLAQRRDHCIFIAYPLDAHLAERQHEM